MGKYSSVIDKLPRVLGTEPAYQDKVNAVKAQIVESLSNTALSRVNIESRNLTVANTLLALGADFIHATGGKPYASSYARVYRDIRFVIDQVEAHLSNLNLLKEAYTQLMVEQFEVEGTSSLKLDDETGGAVRVQVEPYAQVQDREVFYEWCIANGLQRSMALPWQTTNAITKERLLNGEPEPAGVTAHAKTKIVFTK